MIRLEQPFDPPIPPLYEFQITIDPLHVLRYILWKWIALEQFGIQPHPDLRMIIAHAILQQEEIHITPEIHKEIEEPSVLLKTPRYRALLPIVESPDAFQGQIPPVGDLSVAPADLVDAIPVLREYDRTSDGVGPPDHRFHPAPVILHGTCHLLQQRPKPLVSESCGDRIACEPLAVPDEIVTAVSRPQIHHLPVGKLPAPKDTVILPESGTAGIGIVTAVSQSSFPIPETVPEALGVCGEVERSVDHRIFNVIKN